MGDRRHPFVVPAPRAPHDRRPLSRRRLNGPTSQLAFPQDACEGVYVTEGYESSVTNLAGASLDSDVRVTGA